MKTRSSPPLRALFLGTADGHTSPRREHAGILLEAGGTHLLLDCGAAAAPFLLSKKYAPDRPDAIWLSHLHSDHVGQVTTLIQSLWLRARRAPLHFYGPREVLRTVKDWLERSLLFPELIGFPLVWTAVRPGRPVKCGPFTLEAFATRHLANLAFQFKRRYPKTSFACYGAVLSHGRRRLVYSADLAHPRELRPVLQDKKTDVLICELTHFPERDLFRELVSHRVESLWVTHYPETLVGKGTNLRTLAREEKFKGVVHLAQDKVAAEI